MCIYTCRERVEKKKDTKLKVELGKQGLERNEGRQILYCVGVRLDSQSLRRRRRQGGKAFRERERE